MRTDDGRYGPPDAGLRPFSAGRLDDLQREAAGWEGRSLDAGTHSVPVRVYRPGPNPYGRMVWAHGGSWQAGSVEHWHEPVMDLARVSGCTVVSVGYRLAPRHRHPAQLDDVLTALSWAGEQAEHGEPVVVGGDSAGGTIAACAALARRDRGEPLAAQVLAYPPLDPACSAPSYTRDPGAFPAAEDLRQAWRRYRGASSTAVRDGVKLHSTPLEAVRLDGLAPAILAVGDLDPVADDVTEYARRLAEAGNDVRLRVFPHTPHAVFLAADGSDPHGPPLRKWLGTLLRDRLRPRKETT
ncbi:alpha/beta hydrolase [Streptomyces adelaidensis]|uniref:alpha/beta hydrolase n=1 Tax=Streptomyces adelaidensis TaxID=2796465 RepID=UPI0027DCB145|nr:alpha/beta hydrolase [Streptomyces adelaidensis]